jgi:8-oxo-dGTP diphosphatase
MTTIDRTVPAPQLYVHDTPAPRATAVVPSVFVAVRWYGGRLLMVRRCDSGAWELPGGRVEVGESAVQTAVRGTDEEAGVRVLVTGFLGLFTDPSHAVRDPNGEFGQQFAVLFQARAVGGVPRGNLHETSDADWVAVADLQKLPMEPSVRFWVAHAIAVGDPPYLG